MSKIMIYHTLVGASLMIGANREKVWGVDMLTKTINPFDEKEVGEHKADGWQKSPQAVIDELEKVRLAKENKGLKADIGEMITANENAEKLAQLTADNERLQNEVAELKAKLAIYETAQDINKDGQVSFGEMTVEQLKVYLDSKGIKYDKRIGKDGLIALAMGADVPTADDVPVAE